MRPRTRRLFAWMGAFLCVIYLLNLDMGLFELIPDNLPVIGNVDEVGVTLLLVRCIQAIRGKAPVSVDVERLRK